MLSHTLVLQNFEIDAFTFCCVHAFLVLLCRAFFRDSQRFQVFFRLVFQIFLVLDLGIWYAFYLHLDQYPSDYLGRRIVLDHHPLVHDAEMSALVANVDPSCFHART